MDVDPANHKDRPSSDEPQDTGQRPGQSGEPSRVAMSADGVRPADPAVAALLDGALLDAAVRDDGRPPAPGRPDEPRASTADEQLRASIQVAPAKDAPPLDPDHALFQAIMKQDVLQQVTAHADEYPGVEVCGVLIGTVFENPQTSFVYIDGMIRGEASSGRSTAVTFTAETWQHIHRVMEQKHAGKQIIAWYHTHPGFGIFLSEMDLFIQRHFFNAPWQMAFVIDPQSRESGMFAWRAAQVRRVDYVIDDEKTSNAPQGVFPSLPYLSSPTDFQEDPTASKTPAAVEELVDRISVLEARVKLLSVGFAILIAVAIIWPLVVPLVSPSMQGRPATQPAAPGSPGGLDPRDSTPTLPLRSN